MVDALTPAVAALKAAAAERHGDFEVRFGRCLMRPTAWTRQIHREKRRPAVRPVCFIQSP
jgi:hypothetical protein